MTTAGNDRFNSEASNWDNNPTVLEATRLAFETLTPLIENLSGTKKLDVLEVGCGTGLLALRVAPLVNQVVAVDPAKGMIEILQNKLAQEGSPKNVKSINLLLEDPNDKSLPSAKANDFLGPRQKFDLITSHLVLHHVPDLRPFLKTLLACLKPGGQIALTDFEDFGPEAIKFHPPSKLDGVERHGIPREWMENLLKETGFDEVTVQVGWIMDRHVEGWSEEKEVIQFPFLVCEGRRPL